MKRWLSLLIILVLFVVTACGGGSEAGGDDVSSGEAGSEASNEASSEESAADPAGDAPTILVSMKGPGGGNPFWAAVEKGATEKGAELGVNVVVLAPPTESDIQAQISQIEDQLAKGVDAIAIAPTDPEALAPVLEGAIEEGVPVLFIDTQGVVDDTTFIGTNNEEGAKLAADHICQNVPEGSSVAILQGIITQSTGKARADGGKAGLEGCGLNVVAEQPANWDRAEGQSVMENILTGNPDLAAVFASNDNMALGATEAIKAADLLDQIMIVGFDANPDAAASILAGEMSASIAQNPYNMGAFGVENALKLANGESIPANIDTGTVLVTAENAAQYSELGGAAEAMADDEAAAAESDDSSAALDLSDVSILVSMKGPGGGNPFWAAVEAGAIAKGEEIGVEVIVLSPPAESDIQAQIAQIEDQLAKGVSGIAIAPTDPSALAPVLEDAIAEGVPVVFIDTMGNVEDVTFIGTNNQVGAELAANYICENVAAGSDVAILQGIITQSTGKARADGGKAGLEGCGLNVVAEQPANWDRAEGQSVMENILTGNPDLAAVFASNDNMALGATEAIKAADLLDQIMIVGFDANPDAATSILAGEMSASVAQNPYNMGAFGVESVLALLQGETLDPVIDTGTVLVTAENAADYE